MKEYILERIRGKSDFKVCFYIEDGYEYNTFPCHVISITILLTIAFLQHEWNFISIVSVLVVALNLSLISYRLGYADMQRTYSRAKNNEQ